MNQATMKQALKRFDALNAEDPRRDEVDGESWPRELLYGQRMSAMLETFAPDAPEVVHLAARAQHLRRWMIPREDYPKGRVGYHQWRTDLGRYHAEQADAVLAELGYDDQTRERVRTLLQKKGLKTDPDVQLLEDVICLVFLQYYLEEFAGKHPREKVIRILQRTWKKMSPEGQQYALSLNLPDSAQALVREALAG